MIASSVFRRSEKKNSHSCHNKKSNIRRPGNDNTRCICTNRVPNVRWMDVVYGLVICSLLGVMYLQRMLSILELVVGVIAGEI